MKSFFKYLFVVAFALSATACSHVYAQIPTTKGAYWVIESNVKTPEHATVYFYNRHHQLLYKEAVIGVVLDLNKANVRRQLNSVLKESLALDKRQSGQLLATRMR